MVSNIWVAAADNQVEIVLSHIDTGNFSPNSKDPNGYTPIHAAASYGHISLVKLLIERGGDINIRDNEGDTPLHHAEDIKMAKYLVEQLGCDFNIKNSEGQSAADYIEEDGEFPEVVAYLRSLELSSVTNDGSSNKQSQTLPDTLPSPGMVDGREVKYTMANVEDDNLTAEEMEERRKKIESIINSENPEEALRELVQNAVHEGLAQYNIGPDGSADEPANKRNRS